MSASGCETLASISTRRRRFRTSTRALRLPIHRFPSVRTVYGPVRYDRRPLGAALWQPPSLSILLQPQLIELIEIDRHTCAQRFHGYCGDCVCNIDSAEHRRCLDERRSCSLAQQQRRRGRRGTRVRKRTPEASRPSSRAIQQTKCWRSSHHRPPTTRTLPTDRRSCSSRRAPAARPASGGQARC